MREQEFMGTKKALTYMASIMGSFLAMNILLQGDVVLLKGMLRSQSLCREIGQGD